MTDNVHPNKLIIKNDFTQKILYLYLLKCHIVPHVVYIYSIECEMNVPCDSWAHSCVCSVQNHLLSIPP